MNTVNYHRALQIILQSPPNVLVFHVVNNTDDGIEDEGPFDDFFVVFPLSSFYGFIEAKGKEWLQQPVKMTFNPSEDGFIEYELTLFYAPSEFL